MRAPALIALLLCGCFNPDDLFPISGQALSPSDVTGQRVELLRGEVPFWPGGCPSPRPLKDTTVAPDGTFTLDVLRAQAQRLTIPAGFCFQAQTRFASGTEARVTFRNVNGEYELPPFTDWDAAPRGNAGFFRFINATPPQLERPGGFAGATRGEFVASDGGLVWAHRSTFALSVNDGPSTSSLGFGPEELEDFSGSVQLVQRFVFAGIIVSPGQHEDVQLELRAGQALPAQGIRVPFSRGMPCPPFDDPCPLTDGRLDRVDAGALTTLELQWETARPVARVLLRGVEAGPEPITVQTVALDGGVLSRRIHNWEVNRWDVPPEFWPGDEFIPLEDQVGADGGVTLMPRFVHLTLDANRPARGLRISVPRGLAAITEVSLY